MSVRHTENNVKITPNIDFLQYISCCSTIVHCYRARLQESAQEWSSSHSSAASTTTWSSDGQSTTRMPRSRLRYLGRVATTHTAASVRI